MNSWDRLPGEPIEDFVLFQEWCAKDPPIDPGDWWRAELVRRPSASRPETWEDYGEVVNRWAWLRRRKPFLERLASARALGMLRQLERAEAGARALEWANRGLGVALKKMEAWEGAPATVADAVALGIVREHRQRQRDSGEIQRKADAVPVDVAPTYDTRGMTEDELAKLERIEALKAELERELERFRVKP